MNIRPLKSSKAPVMIIFDYGGTLLREVDIDFLRGERAISPHVICNPHNVSAEELSNWETERYLSLRAVRDLGAELTEIQLLRLKYEQFGIRLDISYEEAEWLKWSGSCPLSKECCCPHIEETLQILYEKGVRIGVISNIGWTGAALSRRINELLPDNHFEFVLASSDYGLRKPSPLLFNVALERAGLSPKDVWYCGDTFDKDIIGAHEAGIFPVYYRGSGEGDRSQPSEEELARYPHITIDDWRELADHIG